LECGSLLPLYLRELARWAESTLECGSLLPLYLRELARGPRRWVESILECAGLPPLSLPRACSLGGIDFGVRQLAAALPFRELARGLSAFRQVPASKLACSKAAASRRTPKQRSSSPEPATG